jgi:PEGA domain-containing protein
VRVRVNSDPWSNVQVDGVAAGATPLTIDLSPGPHEFRAELSDGRVIERVVHVSTELDRIAFR